MTGLKFFGTAAVGLACALVGLSAIAVLFNGPDAPLADEGSILAFCSLVLGAIAIFVAAMDRRTRSRRPVSHAVEDVVERVAPQYDFTVIVPIYNRPELLVALHRRLAELWPQWQACGTGEIVVVDDGSTDATPAVARRVAERSAIPMRVVSQANKGVSGARNRGFWEARGRIGLVIDSDCLPDPSWLPAMLAAIRTAPRTLAFPNVYSERRVQHPLEASPSGAPFVGASFGVRVADYIELGGNCELFGGASRDDGDLYLNATAAGFTICNVREAGVLHPIRSQTPWTIFRGGLEHRYDNLLAKRHGDRALFYLGDALMGGSFAGHYPLTIVAYAYLLLAVYDLVAAIATRSVPNGFELFQVLIVLAAIWLIAQAVFMRVLGVARSRWWDFIVGNASLAAGAALGRLRGTVQFAFVLL